MNSPLPPLDNVSLPQLKLSSYGGQQSGFSAPTTFHGYPNIETGANVGDLDSLLHFDSNASRLEDRHVPMHPGVDESRITLIEAHIKQLRSNLEEQTKQFAMVKNDIAVIVNQQKTHGPACLSAQRQLKEEVRAITSSQRSCVTTQEAVKRLELNMNAMVQQWDDLQKSLDEFQTSQENVTAECDEKANACNESITELTESLQPFSDHVVVTLQAIAHFIQSSNTMCPSFPSLEALLEMQQNEE